MKKRSLFLALPMVAALALSACGGGGDAGRPTADELQKVMADQLGDLGGAEIPEDQLACIAQGFVDSDISDEVLRKMVDEENYTPTADEQSAITDASTTIATDCITAG